MDLNLAGKTAVITGGSKGIGLATAQRLAAEGCNLCLVARSQDLLEAAAATIRDTYRVAVTTVAVDIAHDDSIRQIQSACPSPDVLVNNAGDIPPGTIEDLDATAWRRAWDGKVFGYINLTSAYFPAFKAKRSGVVVNVLGIAGDVLDGNLIAVSTGNAALSAFTRAMGAWAPQFGLRVVGVNPGPVTTDRMIGIQKKKAQMKFGDEGKWKDALASFSFGRAATPEEIANAIAFLASPVSAYTSGAILTIDGGASAGRPIP